MKLLKIETNAVLFHNNVNKFYLLSTHMILDP